jgi:hypothetical protein
LSNYELKFQEKDGKKGVGPKPMELGADLVPNLETTILIRSKKGMHFLWSSYCTRTVNWYHKLSTLT